MEFVNVLVKLRVVQQSVREVMPSILNDKENGDLIHHREKGWERHFPGLHADRDGQWVEEVDLPNMRQ